MERFEKSFFFFLSPFVADQWLVHLEEGIDQEVAEELRRRGHKVNWPVTGAAFMLFVRSPLILDTLFYLKNLNGI